MSNPETTVCFVPSGRGTAQCPANPAYPDGQTIDCTRGKPGVWIDLPYPAPECGAWLIKGDRIGACIVIAAGRVDDPRRVKLPFKDLN